MKADLETKKKTIISPGFFVCCFSSGPSSQPKKKKKKTIISFQWTIQNCQENQPEKKFVALAALDRPDH